MQHGTGVDKSSCMYIWFAWYLQWNAGVHWVLWIDVWYKVTGRNYTILSIMETFITQESNTLNGFTAFADILADEYGPSVY